MASPAAARFVGAPTSKSGVVHLRLRVKPGASHYPLGAVSRVMADRIDVCVAAHAREGAANESTIALIARATGLSPSRLRLSRGHRCRDKTVEVVGVEARDGPSFAEAILDRLRAHSREMQDATTASSKAPTSHTKRR
ncbi:hypothetical protein GQ602_003194 [Ophiocordyceps camponoti-floridani]|uniref:Uncharacterized protein n=1 Tax=Ophiocordyceps camponoti-floridani TaxID=2030778 RepID=A0A8H4VE30_9HYPO|nr:hypothetical protein GQ602_003194 [Ophiocordyceps camponoti-floridani]